MADFLSRTAELIVAVERGGQCLHVSRGLSARLGWPAHALQGTPLVEWVHPDDQQRTEAALARLFEPGGGPGLRHRWRAQGGGECVLEWSSVTAMGPDRSVAYVCAREVTSEERVERLMLSSQSAAAVGGWELDVVTGELHWTPQMYELLGLDPEGFSPTSESAQTLYDERERRAMHAAYTSALESGASETHFDVAYTHPTKGRRTFSAKVEFERVRGRAVRVFGSMQDVTELRAREHQVAESQALSTTAFDNSAVAKMVAQADARIIKVNAAMCDLLGRPADELLATRVLDHIHPEDLDLVAGDFARLVGGQATAIRHSARVIDASGSPRWCTASAALLAGGGRIVAEVLDDTERRMADIARERFESLIEATPNYVAMGSLEQGIFYVNPAGRRVVGLTDDGAPVALTFADQLPPEDLARFLEVAVPTAVREGLWVGTGHLQAKDGSAIPVRQILLHHPATSRREAYLSTICLDLREQRELEARLVHSQKLEGLGRLAGGVAHDFNNLLTVVLGNVEMGRLEDLSGSPFLATALDEIGAAGRRAAQLVDQLLAVARRQVLEPEPVSLRALVLGLDQLLRRMLRGHVELVTLLPDSLWLVRIDPGQFEQVLINLAVNARDAMPGGGKLTLVVRNRILGREEAEGTPDLEPGDYVELSVEDTGEGIPESIRPMVFEPFFTTKPDGKGTGLGLATCHGIVRQLGGDIRVDSVRGEGSRFTILLPRHEGDECGPGPDVEARLRSARAPGGTETLLLVEDEPMVRRMAKRALETAGYQVLAAESGPEALRMLDRHDGTLDALLTDMVMPHMSGTETAAEVVERFPGLPVLFISGYAENIVDDSGSVRDSLEFLQKPYGPRQLTDRVRALLDADG